MVYNLPYSPSKLVRKESFLKAQEGERRKWEKCEEKRGDISERGKGKGRWKIKRYIKGENEKKRSKDKGMKEEREKRGKKGKKREKEKREKARSLKSSNHKLYKCNRYNPLRGFSSPYTQRNFYL